VGFDKEKALAEIAGRAYHLFNKQTGDG